MGLRVAAYTGGRADPASRFRVRQYIGTLAAMDVDMTEFAGYWGRYPPGSIWARPVWAGARIAEGLWHARSSSRYDVVLFQRECLSTFVTVEPFYARPRVLDVDDAIWLHPRGRFAGRLASCCDAIICGNCYLAEYFSEFCGCVSVLPTAVDTSRFLPSVRPRRMEHIIGWSGTSGNLVELEAIESALQVVMKRFPTASLRVVCDRRPELVNLPSGRVEWVRWSRDREVSALQDICVGLMPLRDTAWARGKCAFKMLTYMACGVPVVASPVGVNAEILTLDTIGFGATNRDEWVDALSFLLSDSDNARNLGRKGRIVVEERFSVDALAPKLATILKSVANK